MTVLYRLNEFPENHKYCNRKLMKRRIRRIWQCQINSGQTKRKRKKNKKERGRRRNKQKKIFTKTSSEIIPEISVNQNL